MLRRIIIGYFTMLNPILEAMGVRGAPPMLTGFNIIITAEAIAPIMRTNAEMCSQSFVLWCEVGAISEDSFD